MKILSKEHRRLLSRAGFQIMGAIDLIDFIIEDLKEEEKHDFLLFRVEFIKKMLKQEAERINKILKEERD